MTLIAAIAIAQNPAPADLRVPEGWKYEMDQRGTGAVVGPEGQKVHWSGYNASGSVAHVYYELDPSSVPLRASIGGWEASVTVCPDDRIAVSYAKRAGSTYGGGFDYWMKARSVREAAQLVALCLTRIDVMREKYPRDNELLPDLSRFARPSKEFPFVGLGAGWITPFRGSSFSLPSGDTVTIGGSPPVTTKWTEKSTVLDFSLSISEGDDGRVWAVRSGGGLPQAVAVASKPSMPGVVLAMLAALTYRESVP
jgi:hypothetical protein